MAFDDVEHWGRQYSSVPPRCLYLYGVNHMDTLATQIVSLMYQDVVPPVWHVPTDVSNALPIW